MESFLTYIAKVIALQCLLYIFFRLFGKKHQHFRFNRYFLLSILILPFIIPLFNIPVVLFHHEVSSEGIFNPWYFIEQSLPNVIIAASDITAPQVPGWVWIALIIYILVLIPSGINLLYDYIRINKLSRRSSKSEYSPRGYRMLYVPTHILSFSFLNKIFLSELFPLQTHEKKAIITHEEYHLTKLHTIDIVLVEIIRVFCWFNPVILLIQKNLKETHEYLADKHTLQTTGKNSYAVLLRSFKRQEIQLMLGSAYSGSSIKKRLQMIEQDDHKGSIGTTIFLSIIALVTSFLFACQDKFDDFDHKDEVFHYEFSEADLQEEINGNLEKLKNAPTDFLAVYKKNQETQPEYIFLPEVRLDFFDEFMATPMQKFKGNIYLGGLMLTTEYYRKLNPIEAQHYLSGLHLDIDISPGVYAVMHKTSRQKYMEYLYKLNTDDSRIHSDFDRPAGFKGGMTALTKYLRENLKYPALARSKRIEDQLVMRFVITKNGGLVYLNIDEAPTTSNSEVNLAFQKAAFDALRATEGMWQPAEKNGKYVMSKMTLPIQFKFDQHKVKLTR